jgi:hypothetical protein
MKSTIKSVLLSVSAIVLLSSGIFPSAAFAKSPAPINPEDPKVYHLGVAEGFGTEAETFWMDMNSQTDAISTFKEIVIENHHSVDVDMPFFAVTFDKNWFGQYEIIKKNKRIKANKSIRVKLTSILSPKSKRVHEFRMEFKQRVAGDEGKVIIYGVRK